LSLDDLSCALTTCSRRSEGLEEERSMGLKPRGGEVLFANIMVTVYISFARMAPIQTGLMQPYQKDSQHVEDGRLSCTTSLPAVESDVFGILLVPFERASI